MAMTWEKFEALVERLETDAREAPWAYKVRVFLLALLGYVYIFGILALLLALVAFLVLILVRFHRAGYAIGKFALALIGLIFIVARSLWVRLPPPDALGATGYFRPQFCRGLPTSSPSSCAAAGPGGVEARNGRRANGRGRGADDDDLWVGVRIVGGQPDGSSCSQQMPVGAHERRGTTERAHRLQGRGELQGIERA